MAAVSTTGSRTDAEPRVLKVLPRGRVVVDATNFRRVIIRGTGEVLADLLTQRDAEVYAETFTGSGGGDAIVVPYEAAKSNRRLAVR
jgi:hypothetical protein